MPEKLTHNKQRRCRVLNYSYQTQELSGLKTGRIRFFSAVYPADSPFRADRPDRVIRAIKPDRTYGSPVSPAPFPKGDWNITGIEAWQGAYNRAHFGEAKIRTDAYQHLRMWELDGKGAYLRPLDGKEQDTGYCLHYSDMRTSLGCLTTGDKAAWTAVFHEITKMLRENGFKPIPLHAE
jgi:hypothetical protein